MRYLYSRTFDVGGAAMTITPQTALGKKLADHIGCTCKECGGVHQRILAEAELGALEIVITEGPTVPGLAVQQVYFISRNATGKATTFCLGLPIDNAAEPGARVFKDMKSG